jgi:hypothetical protein
MVEGKYPERQAFNKDGVLVTFPTPQHKAKAISRGTHFEENPNPQAAAADKKAEAEKENPKKNVGPQVNAPDEKDTEDADDEGDEDTGKGKKPSGGGEKVVQGDKQLDVAPPQGEAPEPPPQAPQIPQAPQTPERIAAQKAVVSQMMGTDNTSLDNLDPSLTEVCRNQLTELFKKGEALGLAEACAFLKRYVKS